MRVAVREVATGGCRHDGDFARQTAGEFDPPPGGSRRCRGHAPTREAPDARRAGRCRQRLPEVRNGVERAWKAALRRCGRVVPVVRRRSASRFREHLPGSRARPIVHPGRLAPLVQREATGAASIEDGASLPLPPDERDTTHDLRGVVTCRDHPKADGRRRRPRSRHRRPPREPSRAAPRERRSPRSVPVLPNHLRWHERASGVGSHGIHRHEGVNLMARSRTRRDRHMVREPLALHVVTVGPEACGPHPVSGWWSRGFGCMVAALGSRERGTIDASDLALAQPAQTPEEALRLVRQRLPAEANGRR